MILYIHGFNSSASSHKARLLFTQMKRLGLENEIIIPCLSPYPDDAISELKKLAEQQLANKLVFIGSSLGGYYATWLAEHYQRPAVLINPAVKPYELLRDYIGHNVNHYTGEEYYLATEHIAQLRSLDIDKISKPERFMLMLQTGDEVLDYTQARDKFAGSQMILETGGDHGFAGFEKQFDALLGFCGIDQPLKHSY
ncbi:MAG: esterase YqiA [Gammaproteobacteria bacterium]|nr:esterase YqiA [Gammaproteobacteria bacterium]